MEVLPFLLVGLLALGGFLATVRRRRRLDHALQRLVLRDPDLEPTATPLGLDRATLAARCATLPQGDRHAGLEHGVEGPVRALVAGREHRLDCAAFRWWWEQRQHNPRHGHRFRRRITTAAVVRLPARVPTTIRVRPESVLGRLGVTRGGRQLESSEFNRRFRVECADDRLAVMLLDADLQATLLEHYAGRSVELVDDLLVLEGSPSHRDDSLAGVVGELPAVRQDVVRLVAAVPDQLWRQFGGTPWTPEMPGRPDVAPAREPRHG